MPIQIIPHEESFEVHFSDGRESKYFHFSDDPTRRRFMGRMTRKQAEMAAKTFAGHERDKMEGK